MKIRNSLATQKFGRLTVLDINRIRMGKNHRKIQWLCRCDCGNVKWVDYGCLVNKRTKSCGCLQRENRFLEKPGDASRNKCYDSYQRHCLEAGREFNLTIEQFEEITSSVCHYCGEKPSNKSRARGYNGDYIYNGIDRVDNEKGYSIDNCVPCCKLCNIAKYTRSVSQFLDWVKAVHENMNKIYIEKANRKKLKVLQ